MDELLPGRREGDFVEVPAERASLKLVHDPDCICGYRPREGADVKVIDTRCINAYLVPREETYSDGTMEKVREGLRAVLGSEQVITDCISQVQNEGILFRERA